jgi:enoyl-CoA hydratase/carnithine racemase
MQHFHIVDDETILKVLFHAPESSNAFSLDAARELSRLSKDYHKSKKSLLLTSGHQRLFCAGGNLSDYKKLKSKEAGLKVNREIAKCLDQFASWPVVKLALIEGDVLGGGMEWLARFDFRWATPNVCFAFWQKRVGLSPGWGGGKIWASKLGEEVVHKLILESRLLSAVEALRFGLVDQVVSEWKIQDLAEEWLVKVSESEITPALLQWRSGRESAAFSKLWLGAAHRVVLSKWK